jgi:hypothetical protein
MAAFTVPESLGLKPSPVTCNQVEGGCPAIRDITLDCELLRSNAVGDRIVVHRRMLPGFVPSIGISWC